MTNTFQASIDCVYATEWACIHWHFNWTMSRVFVQTKTVLRWDRHNKYVEASGGCKHTFINPRLSISKTGRTLGVNSDGKFKRGEFDKSSELRQCSDLLVCGHAIFWAWLHLINFETPHACCRACRNRQCNRIRSHMSSCKLHQVSTRSRRRWLLPRGISLRRRQ